MQRTNNFIFGFLCASAPAWFKRQRRFTEGKKPLTAGQLSVVEHDFDSVSLEYLCTAG